METISKSIQDVVADWPKPAQAYFKALRAIVHDAAKVADIGPLTETLKWREPAWFPEKSGVGSTLRASWSPRRFGGFPQLQLDAARNHP